MFLHCVSPEAHEWIPSQFTQGCLTTTANKKHIYGPSINPLWKVQEQLSSGLPAGLQSEQQGMPSTSCLTSFHAGSLSYRSVRVSVSLQVIMSLRTLQSQPPSSQVVICCISNLEENKEENKKTLKTTKKISRVGTLQYQKDQKHLSFTLQKHLYVLL